MKKKLLTIVAVLIFVTTSFSLFPTQSHALSGNEPTYTYWMQSGDPKYQSSSYSSWKSQKGTVTGPATMKKTYKTKNTYSVTGSAEIPIKEIKLGLNGTFTKEVTLSTSLSRKIPKGKRGVFQTRYKYKTYKVKMQQWISIDGRKSKTKKVKYVYVKKKVDVDGRIILK